MPSLNNKPANKIVTKRREKTYPPRQYVYQIKAEEEEEKQHDPGGMGWEIIEEQIACRSCYLDYSRLPAAAQIVTIHSNSEVEKWPKISLK